MRARIRGVLGDKLGGSDDAGRGREEREAPPIGQRLLPNICIESEIGRTDEHVLRNVTEGGEVRSGRDEEEHRRGDGVPELSYLGLWR